MWKVEKLLERRIFLVNNMLEFDRNFLNFVNNNFTYSEILLSLKIGIINDVFLKNFFYNRNYFGNLENTLYRMSFFEQEDKDILFKKTLYLYLNYLYKSCKNEEKLKYSVDYICSFFQYPNEIKHLIYYIPFEKKVINHKKDWVLRNELFNYLNKYKILLRLPNYNIFNKIKELCNDSFALISSGKYKDFLFSCIKEINNKFLVNIWPDSVIQNKILYKFNFNGINDLITFTKDNNISIYKCISNNFFMDEEKYLLDFKIDFNEKIRNGR